MRILKVWNKRVTTMLHFLRNVYIIRSTWINKHFLKIFTFPNLWAAYLSSWNPYYVSLNIWCWHFLPLWNSWNICFLTIQIYKYFQFLVTSMMLMKMNTLHLYAEYINIFYAYFIIYLYDRMTVIGGIITILYAFLIDFYIVHFNT